jgi:site-specific DNA recombinase
MPPRRHETQPVVLSTTADSEAARLKRGPAERCCVAGGAPLQVIFAQERGYAQASAPRIRSPCGKPIWGASPITPLLNNEGYIATMYYNRRPLLDGHGPRGARNRKTRHRERPREEWIVITGPAITDRNTFELSNIRAVKLKVIPRGAEWGAWLLRWLVECGHCHLGCNCHKMRGRNGAYHRYNYCGGHDLLRARSPEGRCLERNIRQRA